MEVGRYISSEDYLYEIKNTEGFFKHIKIANNIKPLWSLKGHENSIEGVHVVATNKFATVSHDCLISFWDFDKKNLSNIKLEYPILSSSFNKRKILMIVGLTNKDTNICVVDVTTSKLIEKINSKSDSIFCLNYFDDNVLTCGSKSGSILLIDLMKKKNIYRYEEIEDSISSCSFNTTHSVHIFGTYRGNITLFDFRNPLPFYKNRNFHSHHSINSVFSFNNAVFTAGSDCLIKKFDVRLFDEKRPVNVYMGHSSPVHCLSFSSTHSYFCSSADNGSIRLWKNEEKTNAIQSICSPVMGDKSRENKLVLTVNTSNKGNKLTNPYNPMVVPANSYISPFFLSKHVELKKKKNEIESMKRALTPNIPKAHERKLSIMPKKQIFTSTKTTEKKKPFLLNPKNDYRKGAEKPTYKINNLLNVKTGAKIRPSLSVNPIVQKSDTKLRETTNAVKKKSMLKMNESTQIKVSNTKTDSTKTNTATKNVTGKLNNTNTQSKKTTKDNINHMPAENVIPLFFKTEAEYAELIMLHHKNRVSSMDWIHDNVISVSWDQKIKWWDLGKYIRYNE